MNTAPIRRNEALKPFSREHHHGLLFCWKIREGLKRGVDLIRIKKYAGWFWDNHLKQHFEEEEKYLFPLLSPDSEFISQAMAEHRQLQSHFEAGENLQAIESMLSQHIRFEERILFEKIQDAATPEQLQLIAARKNDTFCDNWQDEFWVEKKSKK